MMTATRSTSYYRLQHPPLHDCEDLLELQALAYEGTTKSQCENHHSVTKFRRIVLARRQMIMDIHGIL